MKHTSQGVQLHLEEYGKEQLQFYSSICLLPDGLVTLNRIVLILNWNSVVVLLLEIHSHTLGPTSKSGLSSARF